MKHIGRRIIFSMLWGIGLIIITAMFMGAALAAYEEVPSSRLPRTFDSFVVAGIPPIAIGAIGLILGAFGLLPGTKPEKSEAPQQPHVA